MIIRKSKFRTLSVCMFACVYVCMSACMHAYVWEWGAMWAAIMSEISISEWYQDLHVSGCINMIDKSVLKEVLCGVMLIMERRFKIYLPINTLFSHHCRHHHTVAILFYDFHKASQPRNTKRQGPNYFVFASLLIGYVTPSIGQCQNFN